jgi:hypothetical protein
MALMDVNLNKFPKCKEENQKAYRIAVYFSTLISVINWNETVQ